MSKHVDTNTKTMTSTLDSRIKIRAIVGIVTFISVSATRAADLATTLHFNPSLSREANPLSSVLGFDAAQLVAANLIGSSTDGLEGDVLSAGEGFTI